MPDSEFLFSDLMRNPNYADYSYGIIADAIKDFESKLDSDHEVGICLASFGKSILMSVANIGYHNPSTLFFYGYVNGKPATLVQHMSQLNFLLVAEKKADPCRPPRRIGFAPPKED